MLVLESGSSNINSSPTNMLTPSGSQYLQPDYLSPLPTSLDSKRSPLALLAQTCSQIGADPPSSKPEKSRPKESPSSSGSSNSSESLKMSSKTPPTTQHKSHDSHKSNEDYSSSKSDFKSPAISSSKSYTSTSSSTTTSSSSSSASESRSTDAKSTDSTTKSSLDALTGLPKDVPLGSYRPPNMFGSLSGLSPYPGLDPTTAAALGLGAAGAFRHPYPHLGSLPTYPPVSLGLGLSAGYSSLAAYSRLKGVNGSDHLMSLPVCRDPYCTGCPSSMLGLSATTPATSTAASSAGVCPAGCTQCDHQKILTSSAAATSSSTTVATSSSSSPFSPSTQQRPYVCNWIAGDNYCGKRFASSEELLQHLRTHTSLSVPSSDSSSFSALLNPSLHPHSHLLNHRTYPTPPLSPLSMARYHPYSKPGAPAFTSLTPSNPLSNPLASLGSTNPLLGLSSASANPLGALGAAPSSLSGSPFPPNHLSPYAAAAAAAAAGLPGVGAYYSNPYSFYGQRLGASVLP